MRSVGRGRGTEPASATDEPPNRPSLLATGARGEGWAKPERCASLLQGLSHGLKS